MNPSFVLCRQLGGLDSSAVWRRVGFEELSVEWVSGEDAVLMIGKVLDLLFRSLEAARGAGIDRRPLADGVFSSITLLVGKSSPKEKVRLMLGMS